jgi:phospholipase/carboxylesterase
MQAPLEIGASREEAEVAIILMHGLGATQEDFADVALSLIQAAKPCKWRFILPQAPHQPVTINMGVQMPAWYDILDMSQPRAVNWDTVEASRKSIDALVDQEQARQIVLAGFSQGAAMALHVGLRRSDITGILIMSGYLLESDVHPCPKMQSELPIAVLHGSEDSVVPLVAAQNTVKTLNAAGFSPTLKVYNGTEHSVCDEEISDVFAWVEALSHNVDQ